MKEKFKRELVLKTDVETNERNWVQEMVSVIKPEDHDRTDAVLDILRGAADAILDRIINTASIFTLKGDSLRKKY